MTPDNRQEGQGRETVTGNATRVLIISILSSAKGETESDQERLFSSFLHLSLIFHFEKYRPLDFCTLMSPRPMFMLICLWMIEQIFCEYTWQICALLVFMLIDVEAESVHAQPQLGALLVFDLKVVDAVHLQVLGDFKILHHRVLSNEEGTQRVMSYAFRNIITAVKEKFIYIF